MRMARLPGYLLGFALVWCLAASQAVADIYQWQWVDPGDPSQGVMQSSVLCPGGAGVSAAPCANLSDLDLTHAYLVGSDLISANLAWINLNNADLSGAELTNANLSTAYLQNATLTNANLSNANITNAGLTSATFSGANLTGADLRGSTGFCGSGANTTNAILPDGTIAGLNLDTTNPVLIVREYNQYVRVPPPGTTIVLLPPIPIHVTGVMSVQSGGTLRVLLSPVNSEGPWDSTISFDPGISVVLGGNLELGVASGTDPAAIVGTTYQLFDWTGVTPSGRFTIVNDLSAPYSWNTSHLYTTGDVTLTVPEPSTVALLGVAAIGVCGSLLGRRKRTA